MPGRDRRGRVLVLLDTLQAGGAERVAVELAAAVDRSRYDVRVLVTKTGGPLEQTLAAGGVRYAVLDRRRRTSIRPAYHLVRAARAHDLVHSHLFGNNVWAALASRLSGVPLIAHEHNRVARHSRLEPLLDRWLIGPAAFRIVCASESVAESLVRSGLPSRKLEVIPNGIPVDGVLPRAEAREELGLDDDAQVVGSVAMLRPEKGHDLLLEAFRRVRGAGSRSVLCLIGDGSERRQLETLADRLGVAPAVVWAGRRDDARRLASAFDVAVLCSRSEGLPLAALEAMAAGVPLVATRVGGLPDLLSDGSGVLVDPDPDCVAAALSGLLAETARASRIAQAGRERVASRHALADMAAQVELLYDRAIEASHRA